MRRVFFTGLASFVPLLFLFAYKLTSVLTINNGQRPEALEPYRNLYKIIKEEKLLGIIDYRE
jgi:hypothetical protein